MTKLNCARLRLTFVSSIASFSLLGVSIVGFATLSFSSDANAWGRRGHALIGVTAATLLADKSPSLSSSIFRDRSFDLGYYANIPDLCWKKTETKSLEAKEHYIDLEIFRREVKEMPIEAALGLDRAEFEKKFPGIQEKAGTAMWRIREIMGRLGVISAQLKNPNLEKEKRFELQGEWLVAAGTLGHYVGDLGMPLHTSENHDGQLTGQKGIHSYFEEVVVDSFKPGELELAVYKKASAIKHSDSNKSVLEVVFGLANESFAQVPKLLATDKRVGRAKIKITRDAYRSMIINGMALSSAALAELWSRNLDWDYSADKFYNFTPFPIHIVPGADKAVK